MPLIKSLNDYPIDDSDISNSTTNEVVSRITFDILKETPQLVIEVESGLIDRKILETAIIKNMDKNRYYPGIGRDELIEKVFDYMFGYWELERYIKDEDISDIDGTRYDYFTIKKIGKKEVIPLKFTNEQQFDSFCKLVAIRNGGILNENDSHCRISDEKNRLRINVSIRPRNISGPAINIRKHLKDSYTLDDLIKLGMIDEKLKCFFKKLAVSNTNILICGKGAAGKTTLLRALVNLFPVTERVLVCESDTELYPDNPNVIVQRIKKANEGGRPVSLRDLVRDGLTMSLDTYIIGEIVGDEAWEFIKAGFTGHRVLGTSHASSCEDAFFRLLTLVKSANVDHTEKTIKRMIAGSLDVIVFLKDFKVKEILEISGYDEKLDRFETELLYGNDEKGNAPELNEIGTRLKSKLIKGAGIFD